MTNPFPQVAVIGAGHWGSNLVRNFAELQVLTAVCEQDTQRIAKLREQYSHISVFNDYAALLRETAIQAVVIATPAETHYELARQALLADKDVFVEKPLCLKTREARALIQLAAERQRILMVGHLLEYHPAILKLRSLVDSGELGQLRYIYSNRLNLGKVRREENILWSFAPHDISVILRLLGDLPLAVTATGGAYLQPNLADVTVTNLLFNHQVRAHIFVSWLHPYKEQRLVVIGSEKMAVFDDVATTHKLMLYDQKVEFREGQFLPNKGIGQAIEFSTEEPLKAECQHFLTCIQTRQRPLTDGHSGLQTLSVLEAAQRSLMTQGQPVLLGNQPLDIDLL